MGQEQRFLRSCRRAARRSVLGAAVVWALAWPACAGDRDGSTLSRLVPLQDGGPNAWAGLLQPSAIRTDEAGRVYVADRGDETVKVFDGVGTLLATLGGRGQGPGEFQRVQDVEVVAGEVIVLDSQLRRLTRMSQDGGVVASWPTDGEEVLASLGRGGLILANSPGWSVALPDARTEPPLLRVLDLEGRVQYHLGPRRSSKTPFADYVLNFVLPAGTRDGRHVWLARLNDPAVEVFSRETGAWRSIPRRLPFRWRRLPPDFVPSPGALTAGARAEIPFDAVSLDIATDTLGRAYILTAVAPGGDGGQPERVAVDVLDLEGETATRYVAPEPATHLAVSADGAVVYLVDESRARVRAYVSPGVKAASKW